MRFLNSVKFAWQGIMYCFVFEKNFHIQLVLAITTFFMGIIFKISTTEWLAILFCSALVLGFEMINTSIEKLSNILNGSFHLGIKQVKDIAAGAVCVVSIMSLIIGCVIFLPKFQIVIKQLIK